MKLIAPKLPSAPWEHTYSDSGGYDCMTSAFNVRAHNGQEIAHLDLASHGQQRCAPPSVGALATAESITKAIAALPDCLQALNRLRLATWEMAASSPEEGRELAMAQSDATEALLKAGYTITEDHQTSSPADA